MGPLRGRRVRPAVALAALAAFLTLAGCQNQTARLEGADPLNTASTGRVSYKETAALGKKWQKDPTDIGKGMAYANSLEALGQADKQLDVLQKLSQAHPQNGKVQAIYGKKLVASGRAVMALPVLEQAAASSDADWRVHSALGSAYDQQGLYEKARASYQRALLLDPDNLTVLNNLGMSHALEGNLKEAEATLRQANALPRSNAQPRIRQNLALVVGLQGRFEEASRIASEDLPPNQVEANMDYLKKMLSQPNTWQQLSDGSDT